MSKNNLIGSLHWRSFFLFSFCLFYFLQPGCKGGGKSEVSTSGEKTDTIQNTIQPPDTNIQSPAVSTDSSGEKLRIELPSGVRINVEPNSVTKQILDYLEGTEPAGKCFILDKIIFSTNSSDLEGPDEQLMELKYIMEAYMGMTIIITGHSDQTPDAERNKKISRSRAVAIQDWLIYRRIGADRMQSRTISDQSTNTRPEICIVTKG